MLSKYIYVYNVNFSAVPTEVGFHKHTVYECIYYIKGSGCNELPDHTIIPYMSGTFLVIKPETPHKELHYTPTAAICFGYEALDEEARFRDEYWKITATSQSRILGHCQSLLYEHDQKSISYKDACSSLIALILIYACRERTFDSPQMCQPSYIPQVVEQHSWNPADDSDIDTLWKSYLREYEGYSTDRFRHLFKERFNKSPIQFLNNIRIQKASQLLISTAMSITDISAACGFSSPAYFTRKFKDITGVTPSDYRSHTLKESDELYKNHITEDSGTN